VDLVYLAGPPAAGKSTLMAELTRGAERVPRNTVHLIPFDELRVDGEVAGLELGRRRPAFPGTDTLAMNALQAACEWVKKQLVEVVCAEGDRLTHIRFLQYAADAGYRVNLFVLTTPVNVLDERCAARGSKQSKPWRNGRLTSCMRVAGLAEEKGYRVFYLDGQASPEELADFICEKVPAMRQLREREVRAWQ
jgi:predicted kinase